MRVLKSDEPLTLGFGVSRSLGGFWVTIGPYTIIF